MNETLLDSIFREAHVVDIDFAQWDRALRLVVVAREVDDPGDPTRHAVFEIELTFVSAFEVTFQHLDDPVDEGHFQWVAYKLTRKREGDATRITFQGSPLMPITSIVYRGLDITRIDSRDLDRAFPGWARPGAPLLRAGVREILARPRPARRP
jgi:hypothetical protein